MKNFKILLFALTAAFTITFHQKGFSQTAPDFTPTVEIDVMTFLPDSSRDFVINVSEIANAPSNGSIVLKIPKVSGFEFFFSDTTTIANVYGGTYVNNILWSFSSNGSFWTITLNTNSPFPLFPAYGIYSIGGHVKRNANTPPNTHQPLGVYVVDGSGGDSNLYNNQYVVKILAH